MTAEGAIVLIWSLTLLLALGITIGVIGMVVRIVRAATSIDRLLKDTIPSAVNIVGNTAAIAELQTIVDGAGPLLKASAAIKAGGNSLLRHGGQVLAVLGGRS